MIIKSKNNIFKLKQFYFVTFHSFLDSLDLACYSHMLKQSHWNVAMCTKFDVLIHNGTWDLVPSS